MCTRTYLLARAHTNRQITSAKSQWNLRIVADAKWMRVILCNTCRQNYGLWRGTHELEHTQEMEKKKADSFQQTSGR
jgi:hypothetical protein